MKKKTQVLIVGAGPTGLTLAAELNRFGIDFIIIDKKDGISKLSKALGIQARTLEVFEEYDIADEAIKRGEKAKAGEFIVNGKNRGLIDLLGRGTGLTEYPYLLILPQSETEALLQKYLEKKKEKIHWQHEITQLRQNKEKVIAEIKSPKNKYSIEADYVVGCDGASSFVRNHLNLKFEGSTTGQLFYVVDAEVDWKLKDNERLRAFFSRNNFILYFPMKGGKRFRIISKLEKHDADKNPKDIPYSEIEKDILNDTSIPVKIKDVDWHAVYKVHSRKTNSFREGRIFLAGDAAHIHTPAGGQGMNTGIQDSYNLGWKLAMTLQGTLKESILKSYDQEREVNARFLLKGTDRAFSYMANRKPFFAFLRIYILPFLIRFLSHFKHFSRKAFLLISEIDIKYRSNSIKNSSWQGIESGKRLPYSLIDNKSIYDHLRAPSFYLLHTNKSKIPTKLPFWIKKYQLPKNCQLSKQLGNALILLRPDKHIAYIGTSKKAVQNYIKTLFSS